MKGQKRRLALALSNSKDNSSLPYPITRLSLASTAPVVAVKTYGVLLTSNSHQGDHTLGCCSITCQHEAKYNHQACNQELLHLMAV